MKDTIFKLKLLWIFLIDAYENWKREIWKRELDENQCCDGRECCCGGASIRDSWSLAGSDT